MKFSKIEQEGLIYVVPAQVQLLASAPGFNLGIKKAARKMMAAAKAALATFWRYC